MMTDIGIPFRTVINVTKAVEEEGRKYLLGESSGPEIDAEEQFMTKGCIADMAAQINKKSIPYRDEHVKKGVAAQLGDVVEAAITPQKHLFTKTLLDPDSPIAMMLWKKVRRGKQYGQSVAGYALRLAKKTVGGGRVLKGFDRIRLDHIANTTRPSWQHGLGAMIAKSQDWSEVDWSEVDEYEEDTLFPEAGPVVEKRSKPDPKAGKEAVVIDSLKKLLRLLAGFDWKSYKEYAATINRDDISLGPLPVTGDVSPVGAHGETRGKPPGEVLPQKSYDEAEGGWLEYIEKARPEENNLVSLADTYERLAVVAKALPEGDGLLASSVAMALAGMAGVLAPPEPAVKAYNEEVIAKSAEEVGGLEQFLEVDAVHGLDNYLGAAEASGRPVLKSFGETDQKGNVDLDRHRQTRPPPAAIEDGVLTDFGQLAQAGPVQKAAVEPGADPLQTLQRYREEILKSDAPLQEKRAALKKVGEAVLANLVEGLSESAPEEDRVGMIVEKAIVPLLEKLADRIDDLERQIAVAKSEGGGRSPGEFLVRKSISPSVRPSRSVTKGRATFTGLVRGDQYSDTEVE